MDLIIKARLHNLFRAKDFNDKKGKWQLQFLDEQESGDGVQLVIHKVSIPDTMLHQFTNKIGEEVEVKVRPMVRGNQVIFYGVA